MSGHAELVRGLVERGADPNRLNGRGQAPIAGPVFKREDKVVRVLVEKGADPRAGEPNAIVCAQMFGRMWTCLACWVPARAKAQPRCLHLNDRSVIGYSRLLGYGAMRVTPFYCLVLTIAHCLERLVTSSYQSLPSFFTAWTLVGVLALHAHAGLL